MPCSHSLPTKNLNFTLLSLEETKSNEHILRCGVASVSLSHKHTIQYPTQQIARTHADPSTTGVQNSFSKMLVGGGGRVVFSGKQQQH